MVPVVADMSPCQSRRAYTPEEACPVTESPTNLSQDRSSILVLSTNFAFRGFNQLFTFVCLFDTYLAQFICALPLAHYPSF